VIKAFRSRGPLRNAKSRVGDVFVSVSRSKHCSTKKTPVKKRESQKKKQPTKPDEILFFFLLFSLKRKIPRWYKCKLIANFGGICSRVWKSSQAFQSFPYLSFQTLLLIKDNLVFF
jgi:hypothetical protein